jgi:hypothetical protein
MEPSETAKSAEAFAFPGVFQGLVPALKTKYLTGGLRVAEPPAGRMERIETAKSAAAFAFPGIFQG